jgi:hypothetical protein
MHTLPENQFSYIAAQRRVPIAQHQRHHAQNIRSTARQLFGLTRHPAFKRSLWKKRQVIISDATDALLQKGKSKNNILRDYLMVNSFIKGKVDSIK